MKEVTQTALVVRKNEDINIPPNWDYNHSVTSVKGWIGKCWDDATNLATELYRARTILSQTGRPRKSGACAPLLTWAQYCTDVGISKSQANRVIRAHITTEKKPPAPTAEEKTKCPRCNGTGYIKQGGADIIDAEIVQEPPAKPPRKKKDPNVPSTVEEINFEAARKAYPGKKRGFRLEFEEFKRKHRDWRDLLDDEGLKECIAVMVKNRAYSDGFWPHFKTYCGQGRYEEALQ